MIRRNNRYVRPTVDLFDGDYLEIPILHDGIMAADFVFFREKLHTPSIFF